MIVERCVPARGGFQAVVKIEHDFVQRQLVHQQDARAPEVFELLLYSALFLEQLQNLADVFLARDHAGVDDRLLYRRDLLRRRPFAGILDLDDRAIGPSHSVTHTRRGGDEVDVKLALEAFLDDFQVQQPQESAAESEAQRHRVLRLEVERAVVQTQLFERVAQQTMFMRLDRIEPGEDHRLDFLEAGQGFGRGVGDFRYRVADLGVGDRFDIAVQVSGLARGEFVARDRLRRLIAEPFHFERLAVGHQLDLLAHFEAAIEDAGENDHSAIRIEPGIENQRPQRRVRRAFRLRHEMDHRFQNVLDADAVLSAGKDGSARVKADQLFDLLAYALRLRGR